MKIAVLTGAGISAESGIPTFRASDGLWENHRIEDVATPEAWNRNPVLVQEFYNKRRKAVIEAEPNNGHLSLVELEKEHEVVVITQNIDDLHERAGSSNIIHLHGMIRKSQSSINPNLIYDINGWELKFGDFCELGSQLRPHVVWFGEQVPMLEIAINEIINSDLMLIIGTSLKVYPAASLIHFIQKGKPIYIIDPEKPEPLASHITWIPEKASVGVSRFFELIKSK